jgi:hypothetical protein
MGFRLNGSCADDDKCPESRRQKNEKKDFSQILFQFVAPIFREVKWRVTLLPRVKKEKREEA